jgi:L-amino acid N-acyltransferase YncA
MTIGEITVREMTRDDGPAVLAVYAEGIATGTATFETTAPQWAAWDAGHLQAPRLVATAHHDGQRSDADQHQATELLGWAALSPVGDRCAYAGVAEVGVYVAAAARGQRIGRRLLTELVERSERSGLWTLQAGILADNPAGLAAHHAAGFRLVGHRERLGQIAGTWHDVLLLERRSTITGT